MNTRLTITLLCVAALAFACGPRSRSEASLVTSAHAKRRPATRSESGSDKVNGTFAVNVEPHALRFALVVSNDGKKSVELTFPSGQEYDFAVVDARGREVYRWGAARMFTQSVQNRALDGGDTMRIDESAPLSLPHGRYVAVATLRSTNFPVQQRAEFELR